MFNSTTLNMWPPTPGYVVRPRRRGCFGTGSCCCGEARKPQGPEVHLSSMPAAFDSVLSILSPSKTWPWPGPPFFFVVVSSCQSLIRRDFSPSTPVPRPLSTDGRRQCRVECKSRYWPTSLYWLPLFPLFFSSHHPQQVWETASLTLGLLSPSVSLRVTAFRFPHRSRRRG